MGVGVGGVFSRKKDETSIPGVILGGWNVLLHG